jgi:hypothetical protein
MVLILQFLGSALVAPAIIINERTNVLKQTNTLLTNADSLTPIINRA